MDPDRRKEILAKGKPPVFWAGEPSLGGWHTEEEVEAATRVIREAMDWTKGYGGMKQTEEFERAFAAYCGTADCVAINGAGAGLDMAMMCLDLQPEDEVISPAINFKAEHLAVIGQGARLVLCEIDPKTFNADRADVERRITRNTRAIAPVHMNGLSAPMDEFLEMAERHPHPKHGPLKVIGDAARACGGGLKGTKIGKLGWMTVFSFHTQKLMTTLGEGGGITTDDPAVGRRLRGLRQFGGGTGEWGTNYKMTNVQAAVGQVQLRRLDEMIGRRVRLAKKRTEMLQHIPELTLPTEPPGYNHTYYLYTILVPKEWAGEKRDKLCAIMKEDYNVGCVIANPPTYMSQAWVKKHTEGQHLPLSDELGRRLFCPSLHPLMTDENNEYICAALEETVERIRDEN